MTTWWDIDAHGNASWSVSSYGPVLQANKGKLWAACDALGDVSWDLRVLLLATGFQETTTLSSSDRDASKDNNGLAANVTAWNLSLDLVQMSGGYSGDPWDLNREEHLGSAVNVIRTGIQKWGVNRYLNFLRGGRTAFEDGHSYGVGEFKNSIKTMCRLINEDHSLMHDDRRLNLYVAHV